MMKRLIPILSMITFLFATSVCLGEQNNSIIETQVLRIFAVKNASYYHKPWKSPDFSEVRGSGFFFRNDKHFPGKQGMII
ncbi:MAG: hypothetical protein HY912_10155, partial [Desulfomonile tiedjei]|nr:hypothetical protein [Desulfomonile tiedjei]